MLGGSKVCSFLLIGGEFDISAGGVGAVPFVHAGFLFFSALVYAVDDYDHCHDH